MVGVTEDRIRRALVSVSDKTGLVPFVRGIAALGVEVVATGGTAALLREAGIAVTEVSQFTGFPEMLDGRVKTLHPKVHGGLLYLRDNPLHQKAMETQRFVPIDLVVVNLYPFQSTIRKPGVAREEAIEQIDIGGPSMLRSAAKNHRWVTVVSRPEQYGEVLAEMERRGGATGVELRERLAAEVFRATAAYDGAIAGYLEGARRPAVSGGPGTEPPAPRGLPASLDLHLEKSLDLRYGENPHQRGGLYASGSPRFEEGFERLHGKELSYNNLLDIAAAEGLLEEFPDDGPAAAVIVKHGNPCGMALGGSLPEAWAGALSTDSEAASGGILAVNREVDRGAAETIHPFFTEAIIAPGFTPEALAILRDRKNRVLVRRTTRLEGRGGPGGLEVRSVPGGLLLQDPDRVDLDPAALRTVTRRAPSGGEMEALRFAWKVAKHVKSNAIVFARADCTLGIGAGQMSRVDSVRLAVEKAKRAGLDLRGSAVASDAFFPFADGLAVAADAGATAAIQPGGSKRDAEVIQLADERGIAMVFTGVRHFRH